MSIPIRAFEPCTPLPGQSTVLGWSRWQWGIAFADYGLVDLVDLALAVRVRKAWLKRHGDRSPDWRIDKGCFRREARELFAWIERHNVRCVA